MLPAVPAIAVTPAPLPFLPAFAVGTPGECNWRVFFARTAERARELWFADYGEEFSAPGEDDPYSLRVDGVPHLAGVATEEDIHHPSVSDCFAMGWDHNCDRCYCDVSASEYRDIDDKCVCDECLTAQEIDAEDHDDFLHWFFNERFNVTDPGVFALFRPADLLDADVLDALAEEAALHPSCIHLMPFARPEPHCPASAQAPSGSEGEGP